MMKSSTKAVELIKRFEGCCLQAYKFGKEKYYTIGYGHYGADVKSGQVITQSEAEIMLSLDIEKAEKKVNKYSNYNFTQNQYDALVSFAFNIGNIDQLTAKGTRSIEEIASHIKLYNKSNGTVLAGLVKRREYEYNLFTSTDVDTDEYYPAYKNMKRCSIVDALKELGIDASYSNRKAIAIANGISDYCGLGSQNMKLLMLLRVGQLKKI